MSMYLGDITAGKVIRFGWNTNAVAGESITRATNGTVSVYKDGGTTQSTTGVTDTEDFDALTGVHLCAIDTSADGTFYSAGSDFMVVLSGATIDGKSINAVLAHFSIANRSALRPTTADRTLDVSAGGEAGVDWANVGSPTTTLNLSGTTVKTATDVETDTADIQSRLPAALVSGRIDASVGAMAANTLTSSAIASDAISSTAIANSAAAEIAGYVWAEATRTITGLTTAAKAEVNAEVDTALVDINLDHLVKSAVDTNFATTVHLDSVIGQLADNGTTATFDRTTDSLEAVRDRGDAAWTTATGFSTLDAAGIRTAVGLASANLDTQLNALPTAAENTTAVWAAAARTLTAIDEDSTTLDLDATIRAAVGLASANLDTQLTAIDDYLDTEVAAIKAKTDNLPAAPAATGDIPTAAAIADAVWDEATTNHTTSGTFGEQLKTDVDAILADTGTDGVAVASLAANSVTASALATDAVNEIADGILDRNMATGTDSGSATVRTVRQALYAIRNKTNINGGTLTVTKTDDTTTSWTAAVTTTAGNPISAIDPASS